MSPGSLPISGTDENPHSSSPKTTIAIPAKTRLFPIGAIAVLPLARLYKTGGLGNTRPNNRLRGGRHGGTPHPVRNAKLRAARYFALQGGPAPPHPSTPRPGRWHFCPPPRRP